MLFSTFRKVFPTKLVISQNNNKPVIYNIINKNNKHFKYVSNLNIKINNTLKTSIWGITKQYNNIYTNIQSAENFIGFSETIRQFSTLSKFNHKNKLISNSKIESNNNISIIQSPKREEEYEYLNKNEDIKNISHPQLDDSF
jgi:hypothetical protein